MHCNKAPIPTAPLLLNITSSSLYVFLSRNAAACATSKDPLAKAHSSSLAALAAAHLCVASSVLFDHDCSLSWILRAQDLGDSDSTKGGDNHTSEKG